MISNCIYVFRTVEVTLSPVYRCLDILTDACLFLACFIHTIENGLNFKYTTFNNPVIFFTIYSNQYLSV